MLARRVEELERLKEEGQRALAEAALEHDAISKDLDREKKRVRNIRIWKYGTEYPSCHCC